MYVGWCLKSASGSFPEKLPNGLIDAMSRSDLPSSIISGRKDNAAGSGNPAATSASSHPGKIPDCFENNNNKNCMSLFGHDTVF